MEVLLTILTVRDLHINLVYTLAIPVTHPHGANYKQAIHQLAVLSLLLVILDRKYRQIHHNFAHGLRVLDNSITAVELIL